MDLIRTSEIFSEIKIFKGKLISDSRGQFSKPFYGDPLVNQFGNLSEVIYSKSKQNVIRGLHFQEPPEGVSKFVHCLDGEIKDVFVDLRKSSQTYGQFDSIKLKSEAPISVFIPEGFGHGFSVISKSATVLYLQSKPFSAHHDAGVNINSFDIDWEVKNPIISDKDYGLVNFPDFDSPW